MRLITDDPKMTGYLDAFKVAEAGGRVSRKEQLPESQQATYLEGFKKGAKDSANTDESE